MMKRVILVLASLLAMSSIASAAYNYATDLQGTNVVYETIDADSNIWGTMSTADSGNAIRFKPTDFQVQSTDGAVVPSLDDTLQFTLATKKGGAENRVITSIQFIEYGHYSLIDDTIGDLGTDATYAAVTCNVYIDITEVGGVSYFGAPIATELTYTSDGDFYLDTDGETLQSAWVGSLNCVFADYGFSDVTKIEVSINNLLHVASETGTEARIEKKGIGEDPAVLITPEVIPEPATMGLLALGGLLIRRKRK